MNNALNQSLPILSRKLFIFNIGVSNIKWNVNNLILILNCNKMSTAFSQITSTSKTQKAKQLIQQLQEYCKHHSKFEENL